MPDYGWPEEIEYGDWVFVDTYQEQSWSAHSAEVQPGWWGWFGPRCLRMKHQGSWFEFPPVNSPGLLEFVYYLDWFGQSSKNKIQVQMMDGGSWTVLTEVSTGSLFRRSFYLPVDLCDEGCVQLRLYVSAKQRTQNVDYISLSTELCPTPTPPPAPTPFGYKTPTPVRAAGSHPDADPDPHPDAGQPHSFDYPHAHDHPPAHLYSFSLPDYSHPDRPPDQRAGRRSGLLQQ
jgi:hypothetical protein